MNNLEIKLQLSPAEYQRLMTTLIAMPGVTTLRQVDTYFVVANGRLKLRQITEAATGGNSAELIAYHRPDTSGARWSSYDRLALTPEMAFILRTQLAGTAGIAVVVSKQRTVAVRQRTRVHLDEVDGLGQFMELETVADDSAAPDEIDQELSATLEWLGIDRTAARSVPGSYSDLMHDASTAPISGADQ